MTWTTMRKGEMYSLGTRSVFRRFYITEIPAGGYMVQDTRANRTAHLDTLPEAQDWATAELQLTCKCGAPRGRTCSIHCVNPQM